MLTTSRSSRAARNWAARRTLLVPTRAPARSCSRCGAAAEHVFGAAARVGAPSSSRPSPSSPGTSLAECTARSISPASSPPRARATQRDLSAACAPRSPARRDRDDLEAVATGRPQALGDERGLGEREGAAAGPEPHRALATARRSRSWTSASSASGACLDGRPRAAQRARARAAGSRGCGSPRGCAGGSWARAAGG